MENATISTDSTHNLSPKQRERRQLRRFPLHIEFRGRDHLNSIDIVPQVLFDGFYEDKQGAGPASAGRHRPPGPPSQRPANKRKVRYAHIYRFRIAHRLC